MASKLYVGGLAYSTTSEGLREFFAQSGNVLSATVITDRFSGQSRGFGFVEMGTAEEAQNAISQLNGRELDGRRITVEVSNPQAPRTGGAAAAVVPEAAVPAAGARAVAAAAKAATRTGRASRSSGSASRSASSAEASLEIW